MAVIGRKYGSFNMQDPANGIWVTSTDIYSAAPNDIQVDNLAESDGGRVVKQQRRSKTFTETGYMRASSRAGLEAMMDAFKTAMARKNQAFDLDYAGGVRRYLANAANHVITDRGLTSAGWSVQFISADGVGWNISNEELLAATAFTSSSNSWAKNSLGSYQVEPVINLTFAALTGGTTKSVSISNGETLRGITITRTWSSGDIVEIDSLNKRVFVNNQPVDFTGQFPVWEPGTAVINYLDDLTTRSVTILVSYTPRWL